MTIKNQALSKVNFTNMHINTCICIIFLFCANIVKAQILQWDVIITGNAKGQPEIGDIKADNEGNLVVTASYGYTNTLNGKILPEPNNYTKNVSFLAKFDPSGSLLWFDTTHIFGPGYIEISKKGDYFFSGGGPSIGGNLFGMTPSPKRASGFIAKCNRNGKVYWVHKYMDYNYNDLSSIPNFKVDTNENIYFMGSLPKYPEYFEIDSVKYYAVKNSNSFIAKFDSSGNLVWIKKLFANGASPYPGDIDVDSAGNVYCIAHDSEYSKLLTSSLFKINKSGNTVNKITLDTINDSAGINFLFTDGHNGLYIVGQLSDTMEFIGQKNTGKSYVFFAKLDSNLNPKWMIYEYGAKGIGSMYVNKVTGEWYVNAQYRQKATLGGISTNNLPNDTSINSLSNAYFAKIDSIGHISWLKNTVYSSLSYSGIVADKCDNIYIYADYLRQLNFLGLNNKNPTKLYSAGIAKFSADSIGFVNQNSLCGLYLKNTSNPIYTHFQWYVKDIGDTTIGKLLSTSKDLDYQFPHKHKYIITLLAIKSGGCTNAVQDTFNVASSPMAGYNAIDTQGCQYVQFLFSDTSHADTINTAVGQSWRWDFGDGSAPLTYTQTKRPVVSHVYTQSGTYTVTLVYGNGFCTDTFVSQKKVVIIPAPKPGFSVSDTLGCVPLSLHVTDASVGQVDKWVYVVRKVIPLPPSKGDSLRTPSFSYDFTSPGLYMIHQYLTGPTGCVTEDSVVVNVTSVFSNTDKTDIMDVTVDTNNVVEINWLPYSGATNYNLYRYTDYDTSTEALLTQTNVNSYQDNNIDPGKHSYAYFIKAQDGCGHFTGQGRIGKTIKLSGFENGDLLSQLVWTPYKDWPKGVSSYQVLREDPGSSFKNIGNANDTAFEDLNTTDIYGECYRIIAISNDSGLMSFSNVFCFSNSPQIFIPDIFTPNGDTLNDVFAPVCMGIKEYSMTIINRWDEKVYSESIPLHPLKGGIAESPVAGWDGMFKGIVCPNGIYVYYIKAQDFNGDTIIRQGKIMLQR